MGQSGFDRHQLAGFDARERGFSRPVEFEQAGKNYRAVLRYETTCVATDLHPSQDIALSSLIRALHAQGYRHLRTQLSFRNGSYLGSRELWVEYPDPLDPPQPSASQGLLTRIAGWFRPRTANDWTR